MPKALLHALVRITPCWTAQASIDHGTVLDGEPLRHTVTLRERDTTDQIRIPSKEVAEVVHQLTTGLVKWEEVVAKYPKQEASEKDK